MIPESIYPNNSLSSPSISPLITSDLDNSLSTADIHKKSAGSESVPINFDSHIKVDSLENLNDDVDNALAEFILGAENIDPLSNTPVISSQNFTNSEVYSGAVLAETQPLKTPTIPDNYSGLITGLETDYFNVSKSGKAEIESVYYEALSKGELAIFNLEGMEKFKAGSVEFIAEAARRAVSNSHLGYVVISEATKEDNFSASAGEKTNYNSWKRKKSRNYCMPAGSQFGVMLVPNGTVGEVLANTAIEGSKRPLFGRQIIEYLNTPYLESTISDGVSIAEANLLEIIPAELSETVEEISQQAETSNVENVPLGDNLEETIKAESQIVNESTVIPSTEIINEKKENLIVTLSAELSEAASETVEEISLQTATSNAEKVVIRDNLEDTTKSDSPTVNESPVIPTSDLFCKEGESNCIDVDNKLKHKKNVDLSELSCNTSPKDLQFSTQKFYNKGDVFQLTGKVFDLDGWDDLDTLKISISQQMKNGKWKTIEVTELNYFKEENEWANFYYELGNLEPGKYQVKLIARDEAGAVSNHAINEFTFLSSSETSNLTDSVLFAIDNATNLDSYTPEELAETKQWLVSVQEGESASDLAASIGATNLGETGLIPNTYIFEFPTDIEPTAIISELENQLEVEYFYPLTWFNLKTYIPPSTFNTNDPLVSEQWHLNNTGQTGGTIGADINEFPALNISLPGNLSQTVSGADINLGIVDDGVQQSHPDILERYLDNLTHNFNIEAQNAPPSLNASQIQIEPRRSDEIGLEIVEDITLDNLHIIRNKPIDNTSVNLTGEMSIEEVQVRWPTPRSDEDSSNGNSGNNHITILGEINYGIEELQVGVRTSRSEETTGNPTTEISQYLEELQVWWRTPRSDDEKVDLKELEQGNDLVLAMLGFNGLEDLQVRRPTSRSDGDSSQNPADPATNDMAVVAVSGSINSLESLQVRMRTPPSEQIGDLTKIYSDQEAAVVIENGLQKVFESWEILSVQDARNIEGLQVPVRTKRSEGNTDNLPFITGTDTAKIVSEILQTNPAEMWVYGKPKNGDADSVVLISGKDPAAVADSILKYDLAEIAVWWEPAPNTQPIDDISTVFDRVWTGGNADQESVRSGETFVEIGTILGRENLDKLWERWNDDNSGSATNQIPNRHGTSVAGVAAASANETGIMGAAYEAGIANVQLLGDNLVTDKQIADALTYQNQAIDVYNSSWKPGDPFISSPLVNWAFETNVNDGRNGLGNITVFAGGNDGWDGGNVNYNSFANSRNTIAVAAIDHNGEQSWYSEPGASLLISAYSSGDGVGITTTATSKDGDAAYTDTFGGTSSAAPLVSGVIALMLQANPNLTQRDVQHILVETADKNDPNDENWETNAAGYDVNYKYGFGGINAEAAVKAAISWNGVSPEISVESPVQHVGISIPDNNSSGVVSAITIGQDIKVEWAEVMLDIDHSWRGDLEVKLISPKGTESILAEPHYDPEDGYKWVFTSNRNWGESSLGDWKLEVSDRLSGETGILNSWKLNLYGTEQPTNQLPENYFVNPQNGHIYFWSQEGSWTDAQNEAESFGGYLVAINDAAEQNWLIQNFPNGFGYIGLTDSETYGATEGNYIWLSGEPFTYNNWQPEEPNNFPTTPVGEDVVQTNSAGQWNDFSLELWNQQGWKSSGIIEVNPAILPQNIVNITTTEADAGEDGNTGTFTITRTGDTTGTLTVNYAVAGKAKFGSDYLGLTGSVTFGAGVTSIPLNIIPIEDNLDEEDEILEVIIGANSAYKVGSNNIASLTIKDNDDPTITITATDTNATEDGNAAQFVVTRTGPDLSNPITVHYSMAGTATNSTDYQKLTGSVIIPAGMSSATIPVNPIFDYNAEGNETVTLNLIDTSFYDLGATTSATATITNSTTTDWYGPFVYENPANGHLYILSQPDTWLGAQNQAQILGGNLVTINDAAENNWLNQTFNSQILWIGLTDSEIYGATEGNYKWVNGEPVTYTNWTPAEPNNIAVTWLPEGEDFSEMYPGNIGGTWNDAPPHEPQTILSNRQPQPGIIEIDPATLTKPIVNFMVTDSQAGENGNAGQLVISRVGKLDEALTVNYTVAGTATNGSDYQPLTGTVTIPAGSSLVTIPIIGFNDNDLEGNETIVVNLAAGNYQIGNKPVAQVTIADDDSGIIGDSVSEFSLTQGQNNWYYGYYDGNLTSQDFKLLTVPDPQKGWVVDGTSYWDSTYWTFIGATEVHPSGLVPSARQSVEQWVARRWVSEVDGDISISGLIARPDTRENGVIGRILVDGVEVWSREIVGVQGASGINYNINTTVKKDSVVDFVVDPNNHDQYYDSTQFTATISLASATPVTPPPTIYINPDTGHRYFLTTPDTWLGAYEQAKAAGGNLVTINDVGEQTWLVNTFGDSRWMGLTDSPIFGAIEGNYKWVNGEPVNYINWHLTEPNNITYTPEGEDFSEITLLGTEPGWNDMPSDQNSLRQGIVEIPT